MASRHRSREWAVQLIYQANFQAQDLFSSQFLGNFWKQNPANPEDRPYCEFIVRGVVSELPQIDVYIEASLENWKMSRVEKVDLAILRVAVFEMLFSEEAEKPDPPVVINEAVEISKKFGDNNSPSFVNGILDSLAKKFPEKALANKKKSK